LGQGIRGWAGSKGWGRASGGAGESLEHAIRERGERRGGGGSNLFLPVYHLCLLALPLTE
jgi:hypothetical protein